MQSCKGALSTSRTLSTSSVRHTRRQAYRERCERPSPTVLSTSTSRARRPTASSTATERANSCSGCRPRPHRLPRGPAAAGRRTTPERRRRPRVRPRPPLARHRRPHQRRRHRPRCPPPRPQCPPVARARHCRKAARVHRCRRAVPARHCRKAARAPRSLRAPLRRKLRRLRSPQLWHLPRRAAPEPRCLRTRPRRSLRRLQVLPPPPSWCLHRLPEKNRRIRAA